MKRLFIFLWLLLFQQLNFPQTLVGKSQLFLGINGVGSAEVVTHYIAAQGPVWVYVPATGNFIISTDPSIYYNSDTSIGNYNLNAPSTWADFNWIWKEGDGEAKWGLGLYKITNSKRTFEYFYLDTRDNAYIYQPKKDLWFYYDMGSSRFEYIDQVNLDIYTGDLVRVSDLLGFTYTTNELQNFWANVLVCISSDPEFDNVRLIWGKHPTFNCISYKVYRSYQINPVIKYRVIATVSSDTYEYIDEETSYNGSEPVYYFIKAYNGSTYSEASNIVSPPISKGLGKSVLDLDNKLYTHSLNQNSPNPFNPTTTISYQIPEKGYVSIKVFDLLGNEITTLVDEYKESGQHTIQFDGNELVSGVYFYILRSGSYLETRKMLLLR